MLENTAYLGKCSLSNCHLCKKKYLLFVIDLPETSNDSLTSQDLTISFLLQPFGVNQPGPYIMYTTVDANGYLKNGSGKTRYSVHNA